LKGIPFVTATIKPQIENISKKTFKVGKDLEKQATTKKIIEKIRFARQPPQLYKHTGLVPSNFGGIIKHCPPVPASFNFFSINFPFSKKNIKLKNLIDENLYPEINPKTKCPNS
jgi:hypothetical protein